MPTAVVHQDLLGLLRCILTVLVPLDFLGLLRCIVTTVVLRAARFTCTLYPWGSRCLLLLLVHSSLGSSYSFSRFSQLQLTLPLKPLLIQTRNCKKTEIIN